MAKGRKKRASGKDEAAPYTFSDEATEKKVKKHIADIKDIITDQDIANAKVPGEEDTLPVPPTEESKKPKDEEKGRLAGEGRPITPWDVID